MTNRIKPLVCFFFIGILCSNCGTRLQQLNNTSEITLTPSKHIKLPVRTREGEKPYDYKSMLYKIKSDTFRISLIDLNRNGRFNDKDDVFVISTSRDTVPLFPFLNLNAANYSAGMLVAYKNYFFEVKHVTENGRVQLKLIPKSKRESMKPNALYSELLNKEIFIEDVLTSEEESIREIISKYPNQMVYFHFWWTSCVPCFNEIPFLQKLEQEGVLVINLASKELETHNHLLRTIAKHEYPGLHYYGNHDAVREFSQNGFPFGVLVESKSGKKLMDGSAFTIYDVIMDR